MMFYNGYEYAPIIVSFGIKDNFKVINTEMQNKFENIITLAKGEIHDR